jgi:uncharacterized membrane protein
MASKPLKKAGETTTTATKSAGSAANTAKNTANKTKNTATNELLAEALQGLVGTVGKRAASSATKWASNATDRLTDYASGDGEGGLWSAVNGSGNGSGSIKRAAAGGALKSGFSAAARKVKDSVTKAFGGGGSGSGKGLKLTNIVEHIDVGVDVRLAYDLWTRFTDFPNFMKKVENVDQASDEKLTWKAQVFWSHRTWESTIVEQVPEKRIVWRSKGEKGSVDGAVTFHELAPDLTRIVVVLEYRPQGLFERTGNLWRAQGRRARLELKHFQRQAMVQEILHPDEVEGWRGEIRDSQVVDPEDQEANHGDDSDEGQSAETENDADQDHADEDHAEDDLAEDEFDEDTDTDADADEDEPEDEPEPRARPRRRSTSKATARRGGS